MNSLIPWKRSDISRTNGNLQSAPVSRMRWDWDRLFDHMLDDALTSSTAGQSHGMPIDIVEADTEVRVRAEVPGIEPGQIDVSLVDDVLVLSGEKVDDDAAAGTRHYSERTFGAYRRSIKLPCAVDAEHIDARYKNGVVTITLRKAETVVPKRIKVKSA